MKARKVITGAVLLLVTAAAAIAVLSPAIRRAPATIEERAEKALRYAGYDVKRVMNITDVGHLSSDADTGEDKMLAGAKREHKSVMEIADFYTKAFFDDCNKLHSGSHPYDRSPAGKRLCLPGG